jgi:hypothetical protein
LLDEEICEEGKTRICLNRDADLNIQSFPNKIDLGHFDIRCTEESTLPLITQPRLDWKTENGICSVVINIVSIDSIT